LTISPTRLTLALEFGSERRNQMLAFKWIRKIGKILRGGAGKREIFLGALCGVLIGFNAAGGLSLTATILLALLLNANIGFVLLGLLIGKPLALLLAPLSFHIGYFVIHQAGLEASFMRLANMPVTALMGFDHYAQIGGILPALLLGSGIGLLFVQTVTRIREQMLRLEENQTAQKLAKNPLARLLLWLVFGKRKVSTADVLAKKSPLIRTSGVVLVTSLLLIGGLMEYLLLDRVLSCAVR
jgi:uncharacterized protein (TIGR03546 family)